MGEVTTIGLDLRHSFAHFPGRRLEPAAPGRLVHRTEAGIGSQSLLARADEVIK